MSTFRHSQKPSSLCFDSPLRHFIQKISGNFRLVGSIGYLDLSANANSVAADQATAGSNGAYGKLSANVAREQKLVPRLDLYMSASGQYAPKNLDSSEKFILGGPNGVRAYSVDEANGDDGAMGTAELRWQARDDLRLISFYVSIRSRPQGVRIWPSALLNDQ